MIDINDYVQILNAIPNQYPFRFIDEITFVDHKTARGTYFFKKSEYFYQGHFPATPITPSVILTETMAQIGLLPLGIVNYAKENPVGELRLIKPILTNAKLKFIKPIFPETKVTVNGEKVYFRMNRLRAKVELFNESEELSASGTLSGIILNNQDIKF